MVGLILYCISMTMMYAILRIAVLVVKFCTESDWINLLIQYTIGVNLLHFQVQYKMISMKNVSNYKFTIVIWSEMQVYQKHVLLPILCKRMSNGHVFIVSTLTHPLLQIMNWHLQNHNYFIYQNYFCSVSHWLHTISDCLQ